MRESFSDNSDDLQLVVPQRILAGAVAFLTVGAAERTAQDASLSLPLYIGLNAAAAFSLMFLIPVASLRDRMRGIWLSLLELGLIRQVASLADVRVELAPGRSLAVGSALATASAAFVLAVLMGVGSGIAFKPSPRPFWQYAGYVVGIMVWMAARRIDLGTSGEKDEEEPDLAA